MKMVPIVGPPVTLSCFGCTRLGVAGTDEYTSASSGEPRVPEFWYQEDNSDVLPQTYCHECAAKLVEQDPTRSVSQFYSDTNGTVKPENLPDF